MRWTLLLVMVVACAHSAPKGSTTTASAKTKLVTLSTESDAFPKLATAMTSAIADAKIAGIDERVTSKVSIEVVQLSIECVDATPACYGAAAKSLTANKLLFAQVDDDHKKPRVTVTLFDTATNEPKATKRTYDTEASALAGIENLVTEATR